MEIPASLLVRAREWARWDGWRRHGPAAGSIAIHLAAVGILALSLGGAIAGPEPRVVRDEDKPLALELLQVELQPEVSAGVTPPPKAAPPQTPSRGDGSDAVSLPDPRKQKPAGPTAPAAPAEREAGVYMPPSVLLEPRGPAGLQGLAYGDPCASRFGKKPKECADDWAARVGTMDSVLPRSKEELKQQFAEFIEPCPWKVGCEGGEWMSTNGTRSVFGTRQHGGAASLGGIHDMVGRLPQKPDFVDPGFGD
jgi:hypothetical protein